MKTIVSFIEPASWSVMRVLRIAIGAMVTYQGVTDKQWIIAGIGALFLLQGVLNIGCAGGSCAVPKK